MQLPKCDPPTYTLYLYWKIASWLILLKLTTLQWCQVNTELCQSITQHLSIYRAKEWRVFISSSCPDGDGDKERKLRMPFCKWDRMIENSSAADDEWAEGWGMIIILWNWIVLDFQTRPDPNRWPTKKKLLYLVGGGSILLGNYLSIS